MPTSKDWWLVGRGGEGRCFRMAEYAVAIP